MADGSVLDGINEHKRGEVAARKARTPLSAVKAMAADAGPVRGFARALMGDGISLIAEVKKASPSAGLIRADFDPVDIARIYEQNGASCLSVLTDERFFQGHDDYLRVVRAAVALPILRKDFTVDAYQIYEARALGADAILLIVASLSPSEIVDFQAIAHSIGLDALVEVHTEEEMAVAVDAGARIIGVNNRNLKTMVTDLATFERLAPMARSLPTPTASLKGREHTVLVAESGIKTASDVARVRDAGASAILVGESLMRQTDIGAAVRDLLARPSQA